MIRLTTQINQKVSSKEQSQSRLRLRTGVHAGGWCNDCMNSCSSNQGCDGQNWPERMDCYNNCMRDTCPTFCPS
jgi:hypothetical protein